MLLHSHPGSQLSDAPKRVAIPGPVTAWAGFVIMVAAVAAAAGLEFTHAVAREASSAPQMQFVSSGSVEMMPLDEAAADADLFLEQKRAAPMEELPAQF